MAQFDPSQFGATPAAAPPASSASFDPSQFGATPADTSGSAPHPDANFLASLATTAGGVGKALIAPETGFGTDIAGALSTILPKSLTGVDKLDAASADHANYLAQQAALIKQQHAQGKDTTRAQAFLQDEVNNSPQGLKDLFPALGKTNLQVVGDAGGTLLDILSAGTYGQAAKGAQTGKLLTASDHAAAMIAAGIEPKTAQTLGQKLAKIGVDTAKNAGQGAATGYGYDVTGNLQKGETGPDAFAPGIGTFTGAAAPIVIGGVRAGVAVSKEAAPAFINSLIKPKTADFAYGKDPGRTVAELGITGNSLPEFGSNITAAKQDVGQKLGAIYSSEANAEKTINAADSLKPIDDAIQKAAEGGKNNQGIVTQLQNIKDALLYEHNIDGSGAIVKTGDTPRDLTQLSPQEAQDFIQHVSDQTQFTGRPSDDKAVNAALKQVYGDVRDKINGAVSVNNPEVLKLNRQYGDLTSAELAVRNRDAIVKRSNMVNLSGKLVTGGAIAAGILTGNIPVVLGGVATAGFDKALGSTAVKTRIAAWLGKESPSVIGRVLQKNPGIGPLLAREFPAFASKMAQAASAQ